jgi:Tfp pilus assembly protein PilX
MNKTITCPITMFRQRGAALIIVLAFVVLLTGLVVAYFTRATTDRQLSSASFNNTASDLLARSALDIVVSDFKQEIANDIAAGNPTSTNILPARSGNPTFVPATGSNTPADPIPNLIRRSWSGDTNSRASAIKSDIDVSVNGRSISPARWNSHLLIPRASTSNDNDTTPISSFIAPDWVLMTRNGPAVETTVGSGATALYNPVPTNASYVVGRYAYAVYDEGGLLDMNVAGYPYPSPTPGGTGATPSLTDIGRKGVITFADLAGVASSNNTPTIMMPAAATKFVLFRNYATTDTSKKLGDSSLYIESICSGTAGKGFLNYYLGNCNTGPQIGTTRDFGQVNTVTSSAVIPRTDQNFMTRQELIKFRSSAQIGTPDTLQYLGTFSREQNKPTWPKVQSSSVVFPTRFYMARLNDIQAPPPDNGASATVNFGLHWDNNSGHWIYYGDTGSATNAIPSIKVNSTVDFFQLLNYALHPNWDTTKDDPNNVATTLAIGAALIDQYDADSNTTRIDYQTGTVYGVEASGTKTGTEPIPPLGYYGLNRPFRNVGEYGYGYRQGSIRSDQTLDFSTATSPDAGVLDFSTYNSASPRSGIVNLNTRQANVLTAVLTKAFLAESNPAATPLPRGGTVQDAMAAANAIVNATESASGGSTGAVLSRADAARLASSITSSPFGGSATDEYRETISRALAEVGQTRTWGLLIDVVAQTGHYPPSATTLANFVVDGEKRYWLHVAIDRFDGTVLGQQLEEVLEQ